MCTFKKIIKNKNPRLGKLTELENSKKASTSTVKEPMEVSRVTSGAPPSALAHILILLSHTPNTPNSVSCIVYMKKKKV